MQAGPDRRSCALRRRGKASDLALMLALAAIPGLATAADDDEPSATPYRPSVSTPATLSAPGWLEVEGGLQHDHDVGSRRDSVPVTFKLAFTPDWGIRIDGEAIGAVRDDGGGQIRGFADLGVVLKGRLPIDEAQAFGLELGALFPSGRRGIGASSGKTDYSLNGIYSADFAGSWHIDLNLVPSWLGVIDAGTGRVQWLGAAALSKSLDERWSATAEISGTLRHGAASTSQLLLATSYNVSKQLVLDAGAAHNLRWGLPSWSVFTGFTWLAWRVF